MRYRGVRQQLGVSRTDATFRETQLPGIQSPTGGAKHRPRLSAIAWWVIVGALTLTAIWEVPDQARRLRSDVEVGRGRDVLYRELQPARTVGLPDLRVFLAAERVIPRDDTFFVVTGSGAAIKDPLVLRWVRRFARYRLLPRRLVSDARSADWIVSYGGEIPRGVRAERVIDVGPGIRLIEVASP